MTELGAVETGAPPANWVPRDSFADRLARIRRVKGWNFMEAGRETGLSGKSWRLWEQHDRQPYNLLEVATKISNATGVSLIWLLTGSDDTSADTRQYLGPYLGLEDVADRTSLPYTPLPFVPAA
jgi:transcriptional regulator with XRE-family HTH domain